MNVTRDTQPISKAEWIKWQLEELAALEDIEDGEFEIYGEDAEGREGSTSVKITDTASSALALIKELEQRLETEQ